MKITLDGRETVVNKNDTLETILSGLRGEDDILLARVNGRLRELHHRAEPGDRVEPVTAREPAGMNAYERSCLLLLLKAFCDETGLPHGGSVRVLFSVRTGLYLEAGGVRITKALMARTEKRMRELVKARIPIKKSILRTVQARKEFGEEGFSDKERLFRYRRTSAVNVYELDGYKDYFYGFMVPDTGYLKAFSLEPYAGGFLLRLPYRNDPAHVAPFIDQPKVYAALREGEEWNKKMGVTTVADLNDIICSGKLSDLMLVQEALQEQKIAEIAKEIASRGGVRFVMIAGPSSSGKTTFSHRLSIQLRALGLIPHPIAVDDYFVDREHTPLDEFGEYDFEALECVDLELFNRDMTALLNGETVRMPRFDFIEGKREYSGETLTLGEKDILVIEGIHALNDRMSYALPAESRYKIYISALTTLNIDEHNRIQTTDGRLIRRMTRDFRSRGASGAGTIARWASVRRGEEKNIFPFQEDADVVFNSALVYELSVLKALAEPVLFSVPEDTPEFEEANRLLKFLDYFLPVSGQEVAKNSILREFLGGSCFKV